MAGQLIMGRGGRATPISRPRSFLLTSLPRERDSAISWGLVGVQETQTPRGWARFCPPARRPPCCLLPSLTMEGAGCRRRARWAGDGEGQKF